MRKRDCIVQNIALLLHTATNTTALLGSLVYVQSSNIFIRPCDRVLCGPGAGSFETKYMKREA